MFFWPTENIFAPTKTQSLECIEWLLGLEIINDISQMSDWNEMD